jgi:hypothetical protein
MVVPSIGVLLLAAGAAFLATVCLVAALFFVGVFFVAGFSVAALRGVGMVMPGMDI